MSGLDFGSQVQGSGPGILWLLLLRHFRAAECHPPPPLGFRFSGFGFRFRAFGYRVFGFLVRVSCGATPVTPSRWVSGFGFSGSRVFGSRIFRFQVSDFRVQVSCAPLLRHLRSAERLEELRFWCPWGWGETAVRLLRNLAILYFENRDREKAGTEKIRHRQDQGSWFGPRIFYADEHF